ncbi:MAG TPA: MarR family transcriptional regulator [Thermoanaerobaculia bacterium]|nr:MarR family transcriptional regulator [Thermoanaerobaculia bacterium]
MNIRDEIRQTRPFAAPTQEAAVALLRTADLVRRAIASVLEPHGITPQQYNVLRILRGAGVEGLPTLDVAERMIEQTPGITRLIDRLESKDLVIRKRCATDRRQVFCRITDRGSALLARLEQPLRRAEDSALASLSPKQLEQLVTLLDKARTGLHAVLDARRPEVNQGGIA